MAEASRREAPADRFELGRQSSRQCGCMVRSPDEGARRLRRNADVLLYTGILWEAATSHLAAALPRTVRRVLRANGAALCMIDYSSSPTSITHCSTGCPCGPGRSAHWSEHSPTTATAVSTTG